MKNPELYHKTIDILVKAYLQDNLMHNDCTACAVGNLVGAALDEGSWNANPFWGWPSVCVTLREKNNIGRIFNPSNYKGEAKRQIDATGYRYQDLAKIESSFELAYKGDNDEEFIFNGLMAVVEALDIIHENTDKVLTTSVKSKFQKV